jgi:hypothetical protein
MTFRHGLDHVERSTPAIRAVCDEVSGKRSNVRVASIGLTRHAALDRLPERRWDLDSHFVRRAGATLQN